MAFWFLRTAPFHNTGTMKMLWLWAASKNAVSSSAKVPSLSPPVTNPLSSKAGVRSPSTCSQKPDKGICQTPLFEWLFIWFSILIMYVSWLNRSGCLVSCNLIHTSLLINFQRLQHSLTDYVPSCRGNLLQPSFKNWLWRPKIVVVAHVIPIIVPGVVSAWEENLYRHCTIQ